MRISVILAHPDPTSFNHAIAHATVETLFRAGHDVSFHDLHQEVFDPLLPRQELPSRSDLPPVVAAHCREIAAADGIVIVHPNWWGQPPAILTGWIDRVLRPGVAYRFVEGDQGEGVPLGLLKAKAVLIFNTANTPKAREEAAFGDPLDLIWKKCIFNLCGVTKVDRIVFRVVITSTLEIRKTWLQQVRDTVALRFPADIGRV